MFGSPARDAKLNTFVGRMKNPRPMLSRNRYARLYDLRFEQSDNGPTRAVFVETDMIAVFDESAELYGPRLYRLAFGKSLAGVCSGYGAVIPRSPVVRGCVKKISLLREDSTMMTDAWAIMGTYIE